MCSSQMTNGLATASQLLRVRPRGPPLGRNRNGLVNYLIVSKRSEAADATASPVQRVAELK